MPKQCSSRSHHSRCPAITIPPAAPGLFPCRGAAYVVQSPTSGPPRDAGSALHARWRTWFLRVQPDALRDPLVTGVPVPVRGLMVTRITQNGRWLGLTALGLLSTILGPFTPLPSGRGVNGPLRFLCSNTRAILPVGARALTPCGVALGPVHFAHPVACARRSAGQAASGYNRRGPLQSHLGWPSIRTPARSGGHPARRSASCRSAEKPLAFAMGSVTATMACL